VCGSGQRLSLILAFLGPVFPHHVRGSGATLKLLFLQPRPPAFLGFFFFRDLFFFLSALLTCSTPSPFFSFPVRFEQLHSVATLSLFFFLRSLGRKTAWMYACPIVLFYATFFLAPVLFVFPPASSGSFSPVFFFVAWPCPTVLVCVLFPYCTQFSFPLFSICPPFWCAFSRPRPFRQEDASLGMLWCLRLERPDCFFFCIFHLLLTPFALLCGSSRTTSPKPLAQFFSLLPSYS